MKTYPRGGPLVQDSADQEMKPRAIKINLILDLVASQFLEQPHTLVELSPLKTQVVPDNAVFKRQ